MIKNISFRKNLTFVLLAILFLAVDYSVSTFCRSFITFGTDRTDEIMGKPNISILIFMSTFTKIMLVAFFFIIKDKLPLKNSIGKAYSFTVSYLIILFIPTLIGMNAYDFSGGWDLFTAGRLRNLSTLICDMLGMLVATPILGIMLHSKTNNTFCFSKRLLVSIISCGTIFVLGIYCAVELSGYIFNINSLIYPSGKSLNFNVLFYTPFLITGAGIPLINEIINSKITKTRHRILRFISLFVIFLWFPLQNVIVAFDVSLSLGLVFCISSLIPIIICICITEALNKNIKKSTPEECISESQIV